MSVYLNYIIHVYVFKLVMFALFQGSRVSYAGKVVRKQLMLYQA